MFLSARKYPSLRHLVTDPATRGPLVRRLFARIADRYDLATVVLSWGQDQKWKRRLTMMAGSLGGREALDLACGTGDIALGLCRAGAARVVGLDVTPGMVWIAQRKAAALPQPPFFVVADMSDLPFPDGSFDVVTTGYGLRNVADLSRALDEITRVLRRGGLFLSLDFERPENSVVRSMYHAYLTAVGSVLGWVLHRDRDTYRYIPESIRHYPGARRVMGQLTARGFTDVEWHPLLCGLLGIHSARRAGRG